MKKMLTVILVMLLVIALFGCTQNQKASDLNDNEIDNEKIKIVTTLFPQYDFARQVAGDKADIALLLPPGAESHSYEPTPGDIITINKADMFIYTGKYMEPWADKIIQSIESEKLNILDVSSGITLVKEEHDHDHEDEDHEHEDENHEHEDEDHEHEDEDHEHEDEDLEDEEHGHSHEYDPHIWTSPVMAKKMVDNIAASLCYIDPENASYYKENAENYKKQLDELNAEFSEIVQNGKHNKIYFGGRFALYYFTEEYGLEYMSAYDNCSSETEPSAHDIAKIIDEMKENKISVIYYEELTDPKVSRSISEDTGAEMLLFHSCHNVSKDDFNKGVTYLDLMKQNAENLRKGLY
ncbi:metal ABC transporter substrate-binding protein [Sedimentibacter sp.]|uniref:metal ABC transporter substrate-binding protein n=1 Tax=Sedimentibacter sp. TaxID=1960295 RepID=UPI0028A6124B|nr:metal ABC transporter substrate-binding protein [Sedimentibacter sp.]